MFNYEIQRLNLQLLLSQKLFLYYKMSFKIGVFFFEGEASFKRNRKFIVFLWFWGHTWLCSQVTPGGSQGTDHMQRQEPNLDWLPACNLSSLPAQEATFLFIK